ncbi:hypothetical protein D9M68_836500 [compost metagenome]
MNNHQTSKAIAATAINDRMLRSSHFQAARRMLMGLPGLVVFAGRVPVDSLGERAGGERI